MARLSPELGLKRSAKAWERKHRWYSLLKDCYDYAKPQRNPYRNTDGTPQHQKQNQGQKRGGELYDSTLMMSANRLANRIQSELIPPAQRWANLEPGPFVSEDQKEQARKELSGINNALFAAIHMSNFDQAAAEWLDEIIVAGTGLMMILEGDEEQPVLYQSIVQSHVAMMEGAHGKLAFFSRKTTIEVGLLEETWPDIKLPEHIRLLKQQDDTTDINVVELTYWSAKDRVWYYDVLTASGGSGDGSKSSAHRLVDRTYQESRWVAARMMKNAGEDQGRSPVMTALPDAKTLNKVKQYLLQNAALAISGVWTVRNQGVMNQNNFRIRPGAMIPVRSNGGPAGPSIQRLDVGGDLQMSQITVEELRMAIKQIMLDEGLPSEVGPVRSATEIAHRIRMLQQDLGAPFGRIIQEGIVPILQTTLYILGELGIVPKPENGSIKLNGGSISVQFTSPLAQSQNMRDVENAVQAMEITKTMSPEAMMLGFKIEEFGPWVSKKMLVDPALIRDTQERETLQGMAGQLIGMQNGIQPQIGGPGAGTVPPTTAAPPAALAA